MLLWCFFNIPKSEVFHCFLCWWKYLGRIVCYCSLLLLWIWYFLKYAIDCFMHVLYFPLFDYVKTIVHKKDLLLHYVVYYSQTMHACFCYESWVGWFHWDFSYIFLYLSIKLKVNSEAEVFNFHNSRYFILCMFSYVLYLSLLFFTLFSFSFSSWALCRTLSSLIFSLWQFD